MTEKEPFCTSENISEALKIISEELYVMGYQPIPNFEEENPITVAVAMGNAIRTMIRHRKQYVKDKREIEHNRHINEEKIIKLEQKIVGLETENKSLKSTLTKAKSEVDILKLLKEQAVKDANNIKSEICSLQRLLQSRNEQYVHTLRQKESELIEMKNKLSERLGIKKTLQKTHNCCHLSDEANSKENMQRIEKFYDKIQYGLENTVQTLVNENINLRNSLEFMGNKFYELQEKMAQVFQINEDSIVLPSHIFKLPGDKIMKSIENHFTIVTNRTCFLLDQLKL